MSDKDKQDVITIGKMVIYKNALIYENSVMQISNICSVWVADHSYVVHHRIPPWMRILALLALGGAAGGIILEDLVALSVCIMLGAVAVAGWIKHKPTTPVPKFALGVERASRRIMLFTAPDEGFVQKAAAALLEVVAGSNNESAPVVMNFDNKKIEIGNATGSTIVGGDVANSLVENFK